ncbi:pentatricopeptide repeat domain-containing protein, putative [Plasmodium vinckei brucechwatti]|uniref:Pentatricopeptide repeat domain-containing protein, putative n=1 Tax=Plasmodium vinckei brucechwatti TaxID=119398 RepID=A0A6V7S9V8_PLAVN|nr:pentatricopeptide repeat domain-containing protein, putative [Plasmodium vinckei brucechwatti]
MRLKHLYYIFFILKTCLCVNLGISKNNDALFLSPIHNGIVNINTLENLKTKRKKIISLFNNTKRVSPKWRQYNYRAYAKDENGENINSNNGANNQNDDSILKKKHSEKEIEQSVIPLNMDWVKVMSLISSSSDVNTTTLAFNAALSAVEKKGCLTSIIELFEIMKKKNIKPDLISYKLILTLCDKYHLAEYAEILFDEMTESDNIRPNYEIYSIMISCFSKVGNGHKAIEFLEKLRNDPFVENLKDLNSKYDKEKSNRWEDTFAQVNSKNGEDNSSNYYNTQFKELTKKIKNVENNNNKIQYSEYANVIFACNISNLHEQGIKYFEELLNSTKYIPSTFIFENIFDLLGKNGNYEKALDYYNKIKDDPNFKKYINVNILNNILKSLSLSNKINIIENIWNNEYDELLLTHNSVSYQIMLNVYNNIDDYEKAFKLFKEMQMKKMLNKKNILPFVYTLNSFKNCGIYSYSIYVLRIAKLIGIVGKDLLFLYNNAMIACVNAKKYDVIISLYTELISLQEKDPSLTINISTLSFVLLAFKELKMKEDFSNLKNLILQKNYKLTPLCSKVINEPEEQ